MAERTTTIRAMRFLGLAVAACWAVLPVACTVGTDDLSRKDPPWEPPVFANAAAFRALEVPDPTALCGESVPLTFDRQGQAFGFRLDLEGGTEIHLTTLTTKGDDVAAVDTVMALFGPADANGFYGATPLAFADDVAGESGTTDVWAAIDVAVPQAGAYFVYVSTFDGAGQGEAWINPFNDGATGWICHVDCGDATPLATVKDLVAAIPATPWTCNPASTPGPWPVSGDLCAKQPLLVRPADLPKVALPGDCGATGSGFGELARLEIDDLLGNAVVSGGVNVGIPAGTRFRLRPDSRIDTENAHVVRRLTFLAASDVPCDDEAWRCAADDVCYDRTIDGIFDAAYLYCLGCDRQPPATCACRNGKQAAADGTVCRIPQGEGATRVSGTCHDGTCLSAAEAACETLAARLQALLDDPINRHCVSDNDCVLVGGSPTCDSQAFLGQPSGTAVAQAAATKFEALLDEFASGTCASFRAGQPQVDDTARALNLGCRDGTCQADPWTCSRGAPRDFPYVEEFPFPMNLLESGWTIRNEGTPEGLHWGLMPSLSSGATDTCLNFAGYPGTATSTSAAVSPAIDATPAIEDYYDVMGKITLQWRSQWKAQYLSADAVPATLHALAESATDAAFSMPLWSTTTSGDDYDLMSVTVDADPLAFQTLQIAFLVDSIQGVGTGQWQIDQVTLAAGMPNRPVGARVIRCLDNGSPCLSRGAGGEEIGRIGEGVPIPTLAMDPCEHWKLVLCHRDEDATQFTWQYFGFPSLGLEGPPLDAPSFVTVEAAVGQANGCETLPMAVEMMCDVPATTVKGYFYCVADLAPDCQDAAAGDHDLGFVVRDEYDAALPLHSPLESMVRVRLQVAEPVPKACGIDGDCADDNPCDADICKDLFCRHSSYNIVPGCCFAPPDRNPITGQHWDDALSRQAFADAQCDDKNACTADACDQGTSLCVSTEPAPGCCSTSASCDDSDLCTTDSCIDNACQHTKVSIACCRDEADCDDQNVCTTDTCILNSCRHVFDTGACCLQDVNCDDQDPCTTDSCGTDQKCSHATVPGCVPA